MSLGLHDARNTARLAWRMIGDGCVMQITKSLTAVTNLSLILEFRHLYFLFCMCQYL